MTGQDSVWPGGAPALVQRAERTRTVSSRDTELFSAISGDYNPLHYDEELAKASKFGGIIVQGGITSAILNAIVAEDLPGPGTVFWAWNGTLRPRFDREMRLRQFVHNPDLRCEATNR